MIFGDKLLHASRRVVVTFMWALDAILFAILIALDNLSICQFIWSRFDLGCHSLDSFTLKFFF